MLAEIFVLSTVGFLTMTISGDIKLDEYESEDIFDVVGNLEKSFAIKFDKKAFLNVRTFGDMCDVIESHIKYENKDDCTKQQAFYKIRASISETQLIDKNVINLDTKLVALFPRDNRRKQVKLFQRQLGVKMKFLTYPNWVALTLIAGLSASFIAFFFDWKIAVSGITFFAIALNVAEKLGKNLKFETVRELVNNASTEHYVEIRRSKLTVNRREILDTIKEAFNGY